MSFAPIVVGFMPRTSDTSILLVVGHPDDDAIFAGELQTRLSDFRWSVVCVTHSADDDRGRELLDWQRSLGTPPSRIHFLGLPDDANDYRRGQCSIDTTTLERNLRALGLRPCLVVTHGERGEYGHPHHRLTHEVVRAVFPDCRRLHFSYGRGRADVILTCPGKAERVKRHFPSQAAVVDRYAARKERFVWATDGTAPGGSAPPPLRSGADVARVVRRWTVNARTDAG